MDGGYRMMESGGGTAVRGWEKFSPFCWQKLLWQQVILKDFGLPPTFILKNSRSSFFRFPNSNIRFSLINWENRILASYRGAQDIPGTAQVFIFSWTFKNLREFLTSISLWSDTAAEFCGCVTGVRENKVLVMGLHFGEGANTKWTRIESAPLTYFRQIVAWDRIRRWKQSQIGHSPSE